MNRAELIERVFQRVEDRAVTKKIVEEVLGLALDEIIEAVVREGSLKLSRFGTFSSHERAAGSGRHAVTGVRIAIAARKVVRFKPSDYFRERVAAPPKPALKPAPKR